MANPGKGGLGAIGGAFGAVSGALGAVGPVLAQVGGTLLDLVSTIKSFVGAVSPATIKAFDGAIKQVMATIGTAFVGAFQVVGDLARELSGVLMPLMQQLEPIIRSVVGAFGNYLVGVIRIVVAVFELLTPVLQIVTDALAVYYNFVAELTGVVVALIKTFQAMISALLGDDVGGFREVFQGLADIVKQVIKALITLYATLLAFAGEEARAGLRLFADKLEKEGKARDRRPEDNKNPAAPAPATSAAFQDLPAIVKQAQQAAFIAAAAATAAPREKNSTEWLKDIASSVRSAADTRTTIREALREWWEKEVVGGGGIFGVILLFVRDLRGRIENFLDSPGKSIRNSIRL